MKRKIRKFNAWMKREGFGKGILCHFYIPDSGNPYYDKADYAHFNLFCSSKDWIIKGTTEHGISSKRGKRSQVPCLNCFEVNKEFYQAIKELDLNNNNRFEFGLLLNKRVLRNHFVVIDVSTNPPSKVSLKECHHYDRPRFRKGPLAPFNNCKVVRIEVPDSILNSIPIGIIPNKAILGILCKKKDKIEVSSFLKIKKLSRIEVFPIL